MSKSDVDVAKMSQSDMRKLAKMRRLLTKKAKGGTLTQEERDWFSEHAALAESAGSDDGQVVEHAKSKINLAMHLDINRKTLDKYMEMPTWPAREAQGYNVTACREWLAKYKSGTAPNLQRANPDEMGEERGASHALARLEKMERQAGADFQMAYDDGDEVAIKLTRDTWLSLAKQLHAFERIIDKDKRDSGEVINRPEVEDFLRMIGQALGYAEEAYLDRLGMLVTELVDPRDPREVRQKAKGLFYSKINESCDAACSDNKFPLWLAEALAEGMRPAKNDNQTDEENE